jgi:hypothetical protein
MPTQGATQPQEIKYETHYHDHVGVRVREDQTTDAQGNRRNDVVIEQIVASKFGSRSGRLAMAANFGLPPRLPRR